MLGCDSKLIFAILLCFAGTASYASAETDEAARQKVLLSAQDFARCVVQRHPALSKRVVVESIYDISRRFPRILDRECIAGQRSDVTKNLWFPSDTLHQMLSNALIERDYALSGPTNFDAVPDTPFPQPSRLKEESLAKMSPKKRALVLGRLRESETWYMLNVMGHCIARRSPEKVRLLALTPIGSTEERSSISSLKDDISACLPAGAKFRMRISDLRGPTIRNYYQLTQCLLDGSALRVDSQPEI